MSLKRLLALVHPVFVLNLFWLTHFRLSPSAQEQESSRMEMLSWHWLADDKKTYMTVTKRAIESRDETPLICGELNHSTWIKLNIKWCRATERIKDEKEALNLAWKKHLRVSVSTFIKANPLVIFNEMLRHTPASWGTTKPDSVDKMYWSKETWSSCNLKKCLKLQHIFSCHLFV